MSVGTKQTEDALVDQECLRPNQRSIKKLNLMYLSLLRETAQVDVKEAVIRFGVEASVAERVAVMDVENLIDHADSSVLQFRMRAPLAMRQLLRSDCSEQKKMAAHVSIISDMKS